MIALLWEMNRCALGIMTHPQEPQFYYNRLLFRLLSTKCIFWLLI